jgi:DNA-binding XRE family transcriptional regulator
MRTAIITSRLTGKSVICHATTEHPDSHYGIEVWVDDNGRAYCEVDKPSEYYDVDENIDNNVRVVIAQRIAALRKQQGMNQTKLAEAVGTNQFHISKIESGAVSPSVDLLARIAAVLGKRIDLVD